MSCLKTMGREIAETVRIVTVLPIVVVAACVWGMTYAVISLFEEMFGVLRSWMDAAERKVFGVTHRQF